MKRLREVLWSDMHSMRNKSMDYYFVVQLQLLCNRIKEENGN